MLLLGKAFDFHMKVHGCAGSIKSEVLGYIAEQFEYDDIEVKDIANGLVLVKFIRR